MTKSELSQPHWLGALLTLWRHKIWQQCTASPGTTLTKLCHSGYGGRILKKFSLRLEYLVPNLSPDEPRLLTRVTMLTITRKLGLILLLYNYY